MMPRLIGITGLAGAGKDTLADALVFNRGATKYGLALPIKQALNAMFGWTMEQWDDRVWKEAVIPWIGKSPRQCAQTMGTEWGRELINPALWTLIAEQRYYEHRRQTFPGPFVIADIRFENEVDMVHSNGGIVVKVTRLGVQAISAHVSEAGVTGVDYTIRNNTSVDAFLQHALALLDSWTEYA